MKVKRPNKRRQKKNQFVPPRSILPKDALQVFSELHNNVPITLKEEIHNNCVIYTASIMIDGQLYTGDHISKNVAKKKACENFLRSVLTKKMNEDFFFVPSSGNTASPEDDSNVVNGTDNTISGEPMELPERDFPWPQFASLAMHNLINHWDILSESKKSNEGTSFIGKDSGKKKLPTNPENYNPVQLLYHMEPNVQFISTILVSNTPIMFETGCVLDGKTFKGQGRTKKAAKRETAIEAIKHVWGFDFYSIK